MLQKFRKIEECRSQEEKEFDEYVKMKFWCATLSSSEFLEDRKSLIQKENDNRLKLKIKKLLKKIDKNLLLYSMVYDEMLENKKPKIDFGKFSKFDDFYKEFTPNEWFDFVRYYASELFFGYILRIYEWILKNSNDNLFLEAYSIYRVEILGSTRNMDEKVYEMDKLLIENNKTAIIEISEQLYWA